MSRGIENTSLPHGGGRLDPDIQQPYSLRHWGNIAWLLLRPDMYLCTAGFGDSYAGARKVVPCTNRGAGALQLYHICPFPQLSLPPAAHVGTQATHATGWRSIGALTAAAKGQM